MLLLIICPRIGRLFNNFSCQTPARDEAQSDVLDCWSDAIDTLRSSQGDCEDHANVDTLHRRWQVSPKTMRYITLVGTLRNAPANGDTPLDSDPQGSYGILPSGSARPVLA